MSPVPGPLGADELAAYAHDGVLQLDDLVPRPSVARIAEALPAILEQDTPARILERDGHTVRSVYGVHESCRSVAAVTRSPRLLAAVGQLLGTTEIYVHQSKVNVKAADTGDAWDWHQDYGYWRDLDGIGQPNLVNVVLFLDVVTPANGPLQLARGSHHEGVIDVPRPQGMPAGYDDAPAWVASLTATEQYALTPEIIDPLIARNGMLVATGRPGTTLFFHPNVAHRSAPNRSSTRRALLITVYNRCDNAPAPVGSPRPPFLSQPDPHPLQAYHP